MDVKIEKGIPVPIQNSRLGGSDTRKREDILLSMEVGDSFSFPLDKDNVKASYHNVYGKFARALLRLKQRKLISTSYKIKGAADKDGFHIRIWLIEKIK